ncbi:MAG: AAA domain-containing protein, partial [Crenarchaeota archaeon]|nr:AAA domain-containing protein [Thermoproteota archaeon]
MLIATLLAEGHALLEGVPGVGKTLIAKTVATLLGLDFRRVQMTPDTLPSDIIGCMIFNPKTNEFVLRKGPVFTNILFVDEINRAPPKTQAALLEAMQERQVTIEGNTLALPRPFMVIATQNPIEMEG